MSHFTKLDKASIVDADAFEAAAKELGFKTSRNTIAKSYHGRNSLEAEVVVHMIPGDDIALTRNKDGKFDMQADWGYMGNAMIRGTQFKSVNELQDKLIQLSTKNTIVSRYKRQGFRADVREDENQNLVVKLTRAD